jgi:hypothetical protein
MWQLRCDGDPACAETNDASGESASHARALAKEQGWTRQRVSGKVFDLCPTHSQFCEGDIVARVQRIDAPEMGEVIQVRRGYHGCLGTIDVRWSDSGLTEQFLIGHSSCPKKVRYS